MSAQSAAPRGHTLGNGRIDKEHREVYHAAPPVLRGDHRRCRACGEYFNSTAAFDKHRAGDFATDRRCQTIDEMLARGMARNAGHWWVSSARPDSAPTRDSVGGDRPEAGPGARGGL